MPADRPPSRGRPLRRRPVRRGPVERLWAAALTRFRDYLNGADSAKMPDGAIPDRLDERATDDPDH